MHFFYSFGAKAQIESSYAQWVESSFGRVYGAIRIQCTLASPAWYSRLDGCTAYFALPFDQIGAHIYV
jgi:hypothetical protein